MVHPDIHCPHTQVTNHLLFNPEAFKAAHGNVEKVVRSRVQRSSGGRCISRQGGQRVHFHRHRSRSADPSLRLDDLHIAPWSSCRSATAMVRCWTSRKWMVELLTGTVCKWRIALSHHSSLS